MDNIKILNVLREKGKKISEYLVSEKIIDVLKILEMTKQKNYTKWIWELTQNAVDSVENNVSKLNIEIIINKDKLIFKHNGGLFNIDNISSLLHQYSIKKGNVNKVGKFGTGFIYTHLISKTVSVEGLCKNDDDICNFNLHIDRDTDDYNKMYELREKSRIDFSNSLILYKDSINFLHTNFTYNLKNTDVFELIYSGIDEFIKYIPFVMCFVDIIENIKINDYTRNLNYVIFKDVSIKKNNFYINSIRINELSYSIIKLCDDDVDICFLTNKNEILSLKSYYKIFCIFPIMDTDNFPFPFVINSRLFECYKERNGIWLNDEQNNDILKNKILIEKGFNLLYNFLQEESTNFLNIHNLINLNLPEKELKVDYVWYHDNILIKKTKILLNIKKPFVDSLQGKSFLFKKDNVNKSIIFYYDNDINDLLINENFWELTSKVKFLNKDVVLKPNIHIWKNIIENINNLNDFKISIHGINELIDHIEKCIDKIHKITKIDFHSWIVELNNYIHIKYKFDKYILSKHNLKKIIVIDIKENPLIINVCDLYERNIIFYIKNNEEEINDSLLELLKFFNKDFSKTMISSKFLNDFPHIKNISETLTISLIRRTLNEIVDEIEIENLNNQQNSILINYLENNYPSSKNIFPELYNRIDKLKINLFNSNKKFCKLLTSLVFIEENDIDFIYKLVNNKDGLKQIKKILEKQPYIDKNLIKNRNKIVSNKYMDTLIKILRKEGYNNIEIYDRGMDFIITIKHNLIIEVELKSRKNYKEVVLSEKQTKRCVELYNNKTNYWILCVVYNNSSNQFDENYIIKNSFFITDITEKIYNVINNYNDINENGIWFKKDDECIIESKIYKLGFNLYDFLKWMKIKENK